MKQAKRKRLQAAGWRVGSTAEFLGLSPEDVMLVEIKLALATALRARRTKLGLTQHALARRLGSSQSRVAKMEAADRSVTMDLLVAALAVLGATQREVARMISKHAA